MERFVIALAIVVIGGAAPVRAWCEATCLAPTAASESHCPTHDPADDVAAISAADLGQCPVLESARPTLPARLDADASVITTYVPPTVARTHLTPSFERPHAATSVFERSTPLRL
jgi:hypothetical protein